VTGGFFRQILRAPALSEFTGQRMRSVIAKTTKEALTTLAQMIEAGTVRPIVGRTYPLADAAEAVRELERGHPRGTLVVTVEG